MHLARTEVLLRIPLLAILSGIAPSACMRDNCDISKRVLMNNSPFSIVYMESAELRSWEEIYSTIYGFWRWRLRFVKACDNVLSSTRDVTTWGQQTQMLASRWFVLRKSCWLATSTKTHQLAYYHNCMLTLAHMILFDGKLYSSYFIHCCFQIDATLSPHLNYCIESFNTTSYVETVLAKLDLAAQSLRCEIEDLKSRKALFWSFDVYTIKGMISNVWDPVVAHTRHVVRSTCKNGAVVNIQAKIWLHCCV